MMTPFPRIAVVAVIQLVLAGAIHGQQRTQGAFIARLGADTVHLERFTREGNRIAGTILQRTPTFRVITWNMTMDQQGNPGNREQRRLSEPLFPVPRSLFPGGVPPRLYCR